MPTKDQMADYLESYAERFALPVRTGIHVDGVRREGDRYIVTAGDHRFEADDVIVASGAHREPRLPSIARELDPSIVQLHSSAYRNPSQLQEGGVLVVGAGNSGGDISLELSRDASRLALRTGSWPHPVRHRHAVRAPVRDAAGRVRGTARTHAPHADRTEGATRST